MIFLRCYPKVDGSVFTYEPSGQLEQDSLDTLVLDLKSKVVIYIWKAYKLETV